MAKSREQKEQAVEQLNSLFTQSKMAVLTDYRGLDVPSISTLRGSLREEGLSYVVAKNTLIKIALKNSGKDIGENDVLAGPVGIAFGSDEAQTARIVYDFAKTHENLDILGAIDEEGNVLSAQDVNVLAKLPSRDQLLAQTVGTIAAPLSGFVRVLNANVSGLVYALKAVAEQKAS